MGSGLTSRKLLVSQLNPLLSCFGEVLFRATRHSLQLTFQGWMSVTAGPATEILDHQELWWSQPGDPQRALPGVRNSFTWWLYTSLWTFLLGTSRAAEAWQTWDVTQQVEETGTEAWRPHLSPQITMSQKKPIPHWRKEIRWLQGVAKSPKWGLNTAL